MQNWMVRHQLPNRDALVSRGLTWLFFIVFPDEAEAEQQDKASDDAGEDDEESDSDSEDSGTITEIRFVPSDKAACECVEGAWMSWAWASLLYEWQCVFVCAVEPMFSTMCDCQALHPDPDDADTDDDDYEGVEYDVEEAGECHLDP